MTTITFRDHLGRQVSQTPASMVNQCILETTETTSLDCRWHRFIYPQFTSHLDVNDPFFTICETKNKIINLREIKTQRAREAIGILSDPPDQLSANGNSFIHCKMRTLEPDVFLTLWERPRRFSATKLLEHHVTEEQIKDVSYLFFLEALLHVNLMAPTSLKALNGFENHIFHALSKRIIVGLPFCFMEVSNRSDEEASERKDKLIQIFKENYPHKLFRDAEEAFKRGTLLRKTFANIQCREDRTAIQKFALMEKEVIGLPKNQTEFFKGCATVFRKMINEKEINDAELDLLRFQFIDKLDDETSIEEIREILKNYLDNSFPRHYFSASDLFLEMYGNKI